LSTFKPEQHRLVVGGRSLHFVAYEGHPAHAGRGEDEEPAMWYMMCEGHRKRVMPHEAGQPVEELTAALIAWAEENTVGPDGEPEVTHARTSRHDRA
jgi:hypothetical protein